tara:strand:- start:5663 stop:5998 length:336 start_codon:yes stop_codon:yes gene_type:complete
MRNKSKLQENQFRALVRNEIAKIIKEQEDEQIPSKETGVDQKAPQKEKPKEDRGDVLEKVTYTFTKLLKNNLQTLSPEEMAESFDSVMSNFGLSKDGKMDVLRAIKSKIES